MKYNFKRYVVQLVVFMNVISFTGSKKKNEGDPCIDSFTSTVGKCVQVSKCPTSRLDFQQNGIWPTFCEYSFVDTLVCCRNLSAMLDDNIQGEGEILNPYVYGFPRIFQEDMANSTMEVVAAQSINIENTETPLFRPIVAQTSDVEKWLIAQPTATAKTTTELYPAVNEVEASNHSIEQLYVSTIKALLPFRDVDESNEHTSERLPYSIVPIRRPRPYTPERPKLSVEDTIKRNNILQELLTEKPRVRQKSTKPKEVFLEPAKTTKMLDWTTTTAARYHKTTKERKYKVTSSLKPPKVDHKEEKVSSGPDLEKDIKDHGYKNLFEPYDSNTDSILRVQGITNDVNHLFEKDKPCSVRKLLEKIDRPLTGERIGGRDQGKERGRNNPRESSLTAPTLPIIWKKSTTPRKSLGIRPPMMQTTQRLPQLKSPNNIESRSNNERISVKKCEEYSTFGLKMVNFVPLLPNPGTMFISTSKCPYGGVEVIVGGETAALGEFPHMAAIGWFDSFNPNGGYVFKCAGSLVSPKFVLTAGSCAKDPNDENPIPVVVSLGDQILDDKVDDGARPLQVPIKLIHKHPLYNPPKKYNDIALFELANEVEFTSQIRPACLWTKSDFGGHRQVIATGWGLPSSFRERTIKTPDSQKPKALKKVALSLLLNEYCDILQKPYQDKSWQGYSESQMCAGELVGETEGCQVKGDKGSPLQVTASDNHCKFYIVGIASFGKDCSKPDLPAVYTRVSSYLDWIESIVWRYDV